jgi:prolyl oligopeptidase PreP (S9A serine peptidase family)
MSVDISRYVLSRATARSADGTDINVFYMHRRDMVRDGRSAVLLNGYGGFNLAMAPSFRRQALYWLERGGVYAVANLRGGGEFGEAWHRAGARENKHHVFEDFEAAIRWFTTSGVSAPSRIAIHGGSNGGLLMGAMNTRFAPPWPTSGSTTWCASTAFPRPKSGPRSTARPRAPTTFAPSTTTRPTTAWRITCRCPRCG